MSFDREVERLRAAAHESVDGADEATLADVVRAVGYAAKVILATNQRPDDRVQIAGRMAGPAWRMVQTYLEANGFPRVAVKTAGTGEEATAKATLVFRTMGTRRRARQWKVTRGDAVARGFLPVRADVDVGGIESELLRAMAWAAAARDVYGDTLGELAKGADALASAE